MFFSTIAAAPANKAEQATAFLRAPAGLFANYAAKDELLKDKALLTATGIRLTHLALYAARQKNITTETASALALELFIGVNTLLSLKNRDHKIRMPARKAIHLEEVLLPLQEAFLSCHLAATNNKALLLPLMATRLVDYLCNNTHIGLALKELLGALAQPHHVSSPKANAGKAAIQYMYAALLLSPVFCMVPTITK